MNMRTLKRQVVLFFTLAASALVFLLAPAMGMKWIAFFDSSTNPSDLEIFWKLRWPRTILAFLSGAGLATSGMAFQAMFRNPLATPFTLGVASGASLGATLFVFFGLSFSFLGIPGVTVFAFIGALISIAFVYGLTRGIGAFSTGTMLLAGIAVSLFFSSLMLFIQYMGDAITSFRIIRLLMGGLEAVGMDSVINVFPFVFSGCLILLYLVQELNLLTIGDDVAKGRGVEVEKVKWLLFFATSLMVAGVVSVCGPIGFVGMIVPHICRLLVGADHKYLLPMSFLFGGSFLALCDVLSRVLIAPAEIPVGVITSLLGGPFFLWLLMKGSRSKGI